MDSTFWHKVLSIFYLFAYCAMVCCRCAVVHRGSKLFRYRIWWPHYLFQVFLSLFLIFVFHCLISPLFSSFLLLCFLPHRIWTSGGLWERVRNRKQIESKWDKDYDCNCNCNCYCYCDANLGSNTGIWNIWKYFFLKFLWVSFCFCGCGLLMLICCMCVEWCTHNDTQFSYTSLLHSSPLPPSEYLLIIPFTQTRLTCHVLPLIVLILHTDRHPSCTKSINRPYIYIIRHLFDTYNH